MVHNLSGPVPPMIFGRLKALADVQTNGNLWKMLMKCAASRVLPAELQEAELQDVDCFGAPEGGQVPKKG